MKWYDSVLNFFGSWKKVRNLILVLATIGIIVYLITADIKMNFNIFKCESDGNVELDKIIKAKDVPK